MQFRHDPTSHFKANKPHCFAIEPQPLHDPAITAYGYWAGRVMSEYQYYEFLAVDRPLTTAEQAEVRQLLTRSGPTATSFTNEYHWGDSKAARTSSWSVGTTRICTLRTGALTGACAGWRARS